MMTQIAEDDPGFLKVHRLGEAKVYQLSVPSPVYAAVLDKTTVVVGPKSQVFDAVSKASGKRASYLKHNALVQALSRLDPRQSMELIGISATIVGPAAVDTTDQKSQGKQPTLGDFGIAVLSARAMIATDIKVQVAITARDLNQVQSLASVVDDLWKQAMTHLKQRALTNKELVPLVDALRPTKPTIKNRTIALEAHAGADILLGVIKGIPGSPGSK
jgi:hypothetical protein